MEEATIVRENLMTRRGYSPYCGAEKCRKRWPRTTYRLGQFHCVCGYKTEFPADFIDRYEQRLRKWREEERKSMQDSEKKAQAESEMQPLEAYMRKQLDLHEQVLRHGNESDEAEAVRDTMDKPGHLMTAGELEVTGWFSAALQHSSELLKPEPAFVEERRQLHLELLELRDALFNLFSDTRKQKLELWDRQEVVKGILSIVLQLNGVIARYVPPQQLPPEESTESKHKREQASIKKFLEQISARIKKIRSMQDAFESLQKQVAAMQDAGLRRERATWALVQQVLDDVAPTFAADEEPEEPSTPAANLPA